jgi:hypothetical protein
MGMASDAGACGDEQRQMAGQIESEERERDEERQAEKRRLMGAGSHCIRCGVEYESPSRPACECAGDPPVDKDGPDHEAYLTRVRRLRWGPMVEESELRQIVRASVEGVRPTMRRVIGDATPAQYDAADEIAKAVAASVRSAVARTLGRVGRDEVSR